MASLPNELSTISYKELNYFGFFRLRCCLTAIFMSMVIIQLLLVKRNALLVFVCASALHMPPPYITTSHSQDSI